MTIEVKIEKSKNTNWGKQFVAKIMSGYRSGNYLTPNIATDSPIQFPSMACAREWLTDRGYTIVKP